MEMVSLTAPCQETATPTQPILPAGPATMKMQDTQKMPETGIACLNRLKKKYLAAQNYVPQPVIETMDGAEIGIIAFGSTEPAIQEARAQLAKSGIPTDFLRIRAIPFTDEVGEFMVATSG